MKYLAVEWNDKELRCLLARVGRGKVRVLAAETVPLPTPNQLDTAGLPEEPQEETDSVLLALAAVVAEWKVRRVPLLVVVPRQAVELLELTVPPVEDDAELPELVQNLVASEAGNIRPQDAMDFTVHSSDLTTQRRVTAVVLAEERLKQISQLARELKLKPKRVLFRPYETGSLFLRTHPARQSRNLLVNVVGEEADLILVDGARLKASRTVRLPGRLDDSAVRSQLLDEIRRTALVAPLDEASEPGVETVFVLGGREGTEFALQVDAELGFEAQAVNVFEDGVDEQLRERLSGSYVPLFAALQAEAARAEPLVDLLHPKKPPKPPNKLLVAAGIATLVLALAGSGYYYVEGQLKELDEQNQALIQRINQLNQTIRKVQRKRVLYLAVAGWQRTGVNWLDELRDLASRLPPERQVVFRSISVGPARGGLSLIKIQGTSRTAKAVTELEGLLRDRFHRVRTPKLEERRRKDTSYWEFEMHVYTVRREPAQYLPPSTSRSTPAGRAGRPVGRGPNSARGTLRHPKPAAAVSAPAGSTRSSAPARTPTTGAKQTKQTNQTRQTSRAATATRPSPSTAAPNAKQQAPKTQK